MFVEIFNQKQLVDSVDALQYKIVRNPNGCAVKIENQSPYAIDVYNGTDHVDRVNPYSYAVLQNMEYDLKVNRAIKTENTQAFNYVTTKLVTGDTSQKEGHIYNGTANVAGDMNVIGGQIDAYIQGDVKLDKDTTVNVQGGVTIEGTPQVELINPTVTIGNIPEVRISGDTTVNAQIQNARFESEIINTSISVNNLTFFGSTLIDVNLSGREDKTDFFSITSDTAGVYDGILIIVDPVYKRPNDYPNLGFKLDTLKIRNSVVGYNNPNIPDDDVAKIVEDNGYYLEDRPANFILYAQKTVPFDQITFAIELNASFNTQIQNRFEVQVFVFQLNKGDRNSLNNSSMYFEGNHSQPALVSYDNPLPVQIVGGGSSKLMEAGIIAVPTTVANTPITHRIYFNQPFATQPALICNGVTSDPRVVIVTPLAVMNTYADISVVRTNTNSTTTSIHWIAMERG